MNSDNLIGAWFAGPKGENAQRVTTWFRRIADDYYAWRRNYFAQDGVAFGSAERRAHEPFDDAFEDRLIELLARLKEDVPFHSPRYAAHMLAEQTLPSIVGYFAAMLYNPNNVSADVAPVTVRLEHEVGSMLCRMIGFPDGAWAHLCSGGTVANIEAMWVARSVRYLGLSVRLAREHLGLPLPASLSDEHTALGLSPQTALGSLEALYSEVATRGGESEVRRTHQLLRESPYNPAHWGMGAVTTRLGSDPALIVPETCHYCFEKALDVLGLGRRAMMTVRVDSEFRMIPDELEAALDRVESQARHVLAVVAVIGSTEEGSIDPLDRIVAIRRARELQGRASFWVHGDGAYGGYLRSMTLPNRAGLGDPRTTVRIGAREQEIHIDLPSAGACDALETMGECDSVTIDPHKLGYVPYPSGAICFSSSVVRVVTKQIAPYIEDAASDPSLDRTSQSIGVYALEGSKPGAAAAAAWLSHSLIPLDSTGHGALMREGIRNACEMRTMLEQYTELVSQPPHDPKRLGVRAAVLCPPGSNIVCYAFRPLEPAPLAEVNRLNREVFQRFTTHAAARVHDVPFFVSKTVLTASRYSSRTVGDMLQRLDATTAEYESEGIVLLRSVLMNPWYAASKRRGRFFLSELVEALYQVADELWRSGD